MKLSVDGRLRSAIQLAFVGGTLGSAAIPVTALAQDSGSDVKQLQGVQVTGSLIRRADTESANPVTTVSRKDIEASGVTTVGQLLQQLPSLTGDALTPQVNNGGAGDGASTISLRGLGSARTLILLDGRRLVTNDVNTIPINMIERVEVLNEGAGTVYGSDAIGGVVNFITRKNFNGTEITSSFGLAGDHRDAEKFSASLTQGFSSSKGHATVGLSYDNNGAIKAPDRDAGKIVQAYLYNQVSLALGGSSRIPTGRFFTSNGQYTRIAGTDGSTAADFRKRKSTDIYNYQTENLLYTPNDHIQMFALGGENFTDNIKGYGSLLFNHTGGHNQLAPEAFDSSTLSDPNGNLTTPIISQYSQYNPLGVDVTKFTFRAVDSGDRVTHASDNIYQGTLGVKVTLFDRFEWDTSGGYAREDDTSVANGYLNVSQLAQQLGPSQNGKCYTDGTYSTVINGCIPVNILGTTGNTYKSLAKPVVDTAYTDLVTANTNISGDIITLPAGPLSGAVGFEYRRYRLDSEPDNAAQLFELSEANTAATKGSYDVKEWYGEFLIPIVKDLPGISSLNFDVGARYSRYSNFGDTENNKYAIEYRPIKDMLLRATYSDIFRAPTIGDLYAGRANSAPIYTDICNGYKAGATSPIYSTANYQRACAGVPQDGSYQQPDAQGTTTIGGNSNLKPERGYTTDFGLVYSPDFYRPLSFTVDWFDYRIRQAIQGLGLASYQTACAASGDARFCGTGDPATDPVIRDSTGQVVGGLEVPQNIGTFFTDGLDFNIQLNYPKTRFGGFRFDVSGTYVDKFTQTVVGSQNQAVLKQSLAGQNDVSFAGGGNPRFKMTAALDWSFHDLDIVLRNRFIATESDNGGQDGIGNNYGLDASGVGYLGNRSLYESYGVTGAGRCNEGGAGYTATQTDGGGAFPNGSFFGAVGDQKQYICKRSSGFRDYQDIQISYNVKPIHTQFTVGVNDIGDARAPLAYSYGPAFNYDASNYDITGRFFYGRVKIYLK